MCPEWQHVSGFVLNEYAIHVGYQPPTDAGAHVVNTAQLIQLATEVRAKMRTGLLQQSVVRAHWSVNGNAKQTFNSLRCLLQQRYSGSDLGYMGDWGVFADACLRAKGRSVLAHDSTSNDALRMRIWMWAQHFQLPHQARAKQLHGNPHVSTTKSITHAIRYAVGRKAYVQGCAIGDIQELDYGLNEASRAQHLQSWFDPDAAHPVQRDLALKPPAAQRGSLLGVVLVLLLPRTELDQEYALDVERKCEKYRLQINDRISSEQEVCFFGLVKSQFVHERVELPLLDLDIASVQEAFQREAELPATTTQQQYDAVNPYRAVYAITPPINGLEWVCPQLRRIRDSISSWYAHAWRSRMPVESRCCSSMCEMSWASVCRWRSLPKPNAHSA